LKLETRISHPVALRHRWLGRALAAGLAAATFLVYLATAAPGAWWGDGLELACAAWTLGIPHPTGYPVYTLLGHVWMHLPGWSEPGRALTLMSTTLLGLTTGLLVLFFRDRLIELSTRLASGPACDCGMATLLPAAGVALSLAFAASVWEHATIAEVYPLTYFIGALILIVAWTQPVEPGDPRPGLGRAATLGLLVGLGKLNHYSILAVSPLAVFSAIAWGRGRRRGWAHLAILIGVSTFVILCGWLYLMLRARANPPLNWGDPSTPQRLWSHLTGGQFRETKAGIGLWLVIEGLGRWLRWWGEQWLPPWLAGPWTSGVLGLVFVGVATVGLARLASLRPALGWGLLAAVAGTAGFAAAYHIPDIDGFFMIGLPAAAVGWVVALLAALGRLRRVHPEWARGPVLRALPAVFALALVAFHFRAIDKSWDSAPLVWGERAMEALPPDAIVMTGGDSDIFALWYQQMALGKRPDVSIIGSNFIFQDWYPKYFESAGRPRVAIHAEGRTPPLRWIYDQALIEWVILPNLNAGRRIFVTYAGYPSMLGEFFSPRAFAGPFLPADYLDLTAYPYEIPLPRLYELQPNPEIAALDRDALTARLIAFYRRAAAQGWKGD
jgi:hypothetical protein